MFYINKTFCMWQIKGTKCTLFSIKLYGKYIASYAENELSDQERPITSDISHLFNSHLNNSNSIRLFSIHMI